MAPEVWLIGSKRFVCQVQIGGNSEVFHNKQVFGLTMFAKTLYTQSTAQY